MDGSANNVTRRQLYSSKTIAELQEISKSKGVFTAKKWKKDKIINT